MVNLFVILFAFIMSTGKEVSETVRTGLCSDPATWKGGKVPGVGSVVIINPKHTVTLDINIQIGSMDIKNGGTLSFNRKSTVSLFSSGNIVVDGRLLVKPFNANYTHTIRFLDVDEGKMIGGGMKVLNSDVGLYVGPNGVVDIQGTAKTPFLHLAGGAKKGDKTISLNITPKGWKVGDELVISPNGPPDSRSFYTEFEERKITKITRGLITLDYPLNFDHPAIKDPFSSKYYTGEVMNLSRNVVITGTGNGTASPLTNGRAHIMFLMVKKPQTVKYTLLDHLGPRKLLKDGYTDEVQGRYPLHFHHCENGSKGTIVEGVAIRNSGSHAFVPHASNGITFKGCIAYNTYESPYWWDVPPDKGGSPENNSDDIIFDNCIAAKTLADPTFRGYRLPSFHLGSGARNVITNCIAVGNYGNAGAAGFLWPESSNYTDNLWTFINNLAHNNKTNGIFIWQNDTNRHRIVNYVAYNNGLSAIEQGAYANAYKVENNTLINNKYGVFLHSNPIANGELEEGYIVSFKDIRSTDPLYVTVHTLPGKGPTLFKDCIFPKVIISELPKRLPTPSPGLFDFVNCEIGEFVIEGMEPGSLIRVQNKQGAFQINEKGKVTQIKNFF